MICLGRNGLPKTFVTDIPRCQEKSIKRQREQQAFLPEWTPLESDQNITYLNPDNPSATRVLFLTLKKKYSISSSRTDKKSPTSQRRRPEQSITATTHSSLSQNKDSSKYSPNQPSYQTRFTWSWLSTRHLEHLEVVPVPRHPQERLALEKKELDAEDVFLVPGDQFAFRLDLGFETPGKGLLKEHK